MRTTDYNTSALVYRLRKDKITYHNGSRLDELPIIVKCLSKFLRGVRFFSTSAKGISQKRNLDTCLLVRVRVDKVYVALNVVEGPSKDHLSRKMKMCHGYVAS